MNFREWFYTEIADIVGRDASHIDFIQKNGGFSHHFSIGNQDFKVIFSPTNNYGEIADIYNISFIGPNTYSLTGASGTTANVIYTQLLLTVKRFMETHEVNGVSFIGAEPAQNLIYKRFYNQFLKKDFLPVSQGLFIKKTKLRQMLNNMPADEKKQEFKYYIKNSRQTRAELEENKKIKAIEKFLRKKLYSFIYIKGYYQEPKLCYLHEIDTNYVGVIVDNPEISSPEWKPKQKVITEKVPSKEEIYNFLLKINKQFSLNYLFAYESGQHLEKIMNDFGIARPNTKEELEKLVGNLAYTNTDQVLYLIEINDEVTAEVIIANNYGEINTRYIALERINYAKKVIDDDAINFLEKVAYQFKNKYGKNLEEMPYGAKIIDLMKQYGVEYPPQEQNEFEF